MCPALGGGWNHPWKFNEPGEWLQCCAGSVLLCQPVLLSAVGFRAAGLCSITSKELPLFLPSSETSARFLTIGKEGEFIVQVREVPVSGMRSCVLIKTYKIVSMVCAEQLGWILWRGKAWIVPGVLSSSHVIPSSSGSATWLPGGSAAAPARALALFRLSLTSGRLSQPVLS